MTTRKTKPLSTPQAIFNKVCRHLMKQRKKSEMSDRICGCAYRGDGGLMCAVGCLIADKYYSKDLEGAGYSNELVKEALVRSGVNDSGHSFAIIGLLQRVHDDTSPSRWPAGLREVAKTSDLRLPACIKEAP